MANLKVNSKSDLKQRVDLSAMIALVYLSVHRYRHDCGDERFYMAYLYKTGGRGDTRLLVSNRMIGVALFKPIVSNCGKTRRNVLLIAISLLAEMRDEVSSSALSHYM